MCKRNMVICLPEGAGDWAGVSQLQACIFKLPRRAIHLSGYFSKPEALERVPWHQQASVMFHILFFSRS